MDRTIYKSLLQTIKNRPVTLITGARQVGKTYLCYLLEKEMGFKYVSLDNMYDKLYANEDPIGFLEKFPTPLIIDEVQYAPNLFIALEQKVNEQKHQTGNNYGMYVLTGSEAYSLMQGVSESMAGRVSLINLPPFSLREILSLKEVPFLSSSCNVLENINHYSLSQHELFNIIVRGFYPEIVINKDLDSRSFYSDYVETYINRDVCKISNITNKRKFFEFMQLLASLTGEELVYDNIAKQLGLTNVTIRSWISILIAGDIIRLLQPYNENSLLKRVVKRPKVYFLDTGLAAYLTRLDNADVLMNSHFKGQFFETFVVNEIFKSYLNNKNKPNIYYYRDSDQKEIDIVLFEDGKLNLIECKCGITFTSDAIKSFSTLMKATKQDIGIKCIICNTPTLYKISKDVFVFPVSVI